MVHVTRWWDDALSVANNWARETGRRQKVEGFHWNIGQSRIKIWIVTEVWSS